MTHQQHTLNIQNQFNTLFTWADENNISEKNFPRDIDTLLQMETLVLVDMGLQILPKEIALLKNLTTLLLGYNKIEILPTELFLLKNLENLSIQGNKLCYIDENILKLKKLETLHAYDNNINYITTAIITMSNLQFLTLYDNAFSKLALDVYKALNYSENLYVSFIADLPKEKLRDFSLAFGEHLVSRSLSTKLDNY